MTNKSLLKDFSALNVFSACGQHFEYVEMPNPPLVPSLMSWENGRQIEKGCLKEEEQQISG